MRKRLILILFLCLVLLACNVFGNDEVTPTTFPTIVPSNAVELPVVISDSGRIFEIEGFRVNIFPQDGKFIYQGTITTPSPCHIVVVSPIIAESYPEQVTLSVEVRDPEEICIQLISEQDFQGEIPVSRDARFVVSLNGERVS